MAQGEGTRTKGLQTSNRIKCIANCNQTGSWVSRYALPQQNDTLKAWYEMQGSFKCEKSFFPQFVFSPKRRKASVSREEIMEMRSFKCEEFLIVGGGVFRACRLETVERIKRGGWGETSGVMAVLKDALNWGFESRLKDEPK